MTLRLALARSAIVLASFVPYAGAADVPSAAVAAPVRVDLNTDNGRKDMLSRHGENWTLPQNGDATRAFGNVSVTLRPAGGGRLESISWKGGIDSGATLSTDGIANRSGGIEFVLTGLTPGKHSLVTYHNAVSEPRPGKCQVGVAGAEGRTVLPALKATNDYDAASAFVQFDVKQGQEIVIAIMPQGAGGTVLNGFEIDAADPARRAIKPTPTHGDEHAAENPVLRWTSPGTAATHQVYLGTSADSVAAATPASPEFKGTVNTSQFQTEGLDPFADYFWRVDEVSSGGDATPTRGEVWRFRVRRLAFPGAEGYGRFARGGRGGRVIEVTNLDDSGPGSFRAAVEAEGPRTVVFRVGGTIQLKSKLVIRNPYITVAGQTAPGDGICIRGYTFGNLGSHDTIIRYVRIRVGDESGQTMDGTGFASADHCIMDHISVSWSQDEAVSSRGAKNITFQRSIVAQPLNIAGHAKYEAGKSHGFAGSISGNVGSFHHNLVAHAAGRNWSLAGGLTQMGKFAGYLDIRNNVVYNWNHRTNDGGVKALNLVGNLYIPGPATEVFHLLMPDAGSPQDPQQYYMAGNVMEGKDYDRDNWANGGVRMPRRSAPGAGTGSLAVIKLNKPFCESFITEHDAKGAYESVMADVGCNWPRLDAVDQRVLQDVATRKASFKGSRSGLPGHIDSQNDAGGWPELKGGDAPPDADHDGMPDAWEQQQKLNPNDPADGNAVAADGYTHLERYINGIVANRPGSAVPAAAKAPATADDDGTGRSGSPRR